MCSARPQQIWDERQKLKLKKLVVDHQIAFINRLVRQRQNEILNQDKKLAEAYAVSLKVINEMDKAGTPINFTPTYGELKWLSETQRRSIIEWQTQTWKELQAVGFKEKPENLTCEGILKFAKSANARQEAKDAALDELADFGGEFSEFMCEWHALCELFNNSTSEVAALKEAIDWGKEQVYTLNAKLTHSNQPMEEIEQEQLGYLDPVVEQPGHLEPVAEKLTVEDHNNGFKPGGNSKNANEVAATNGANGSNNSSLLGEDNDNFVDIGKH